MIALPAFLVYFIIALVVRFRQKRLISAAGGKGSEKLPGPTGSPARTAFEQSPVGSPYSHIPPPASRAAKTEEPRNKAEKTKQKEQPKKKGRNTLLILRTVVAVLFSVFALVGIFAQVAGASTAIACTMLAINSAILVTALIAEVIIYHSRRGFVRKNSVKHNGILRIKGQFQDYTSLLHNRTITVPHSTLNQYRSFSPERYLLGDMDSNEAYYRRIVEDCERCRVKKQEYDNAVSTLLSKSSHTGESMPFYLDNKAFLKVEKRLIDKESIFIPTGFRLDVIWKYTSPAGRNSYSYAQGSTG